MVYDWVLAEDPGTDVMGPRQVTRLIRGTGEKRLLEIAIDGDVLTATDYRPFWVESHQARRRCSQ